jgi:molybdenum cofactor biosynthesis protein B
MRGATYHECVSVADHRNSSPQCAHCAVITVSDTRTDATDTSGRAIVALLEDAGHRVARRAIVPDDPSCIRVTLEEALADPRVQVVLTTGGTGITSRDSTYEVVAARLEKTLDGFGELFRALSFKEIGAAAMMSRACAGLAARRVIIAMPGSEAAVRLAMTQLVLPELGHLVREATR